MGRRAWGYLTAALTADVVVSFVLRPGLAASAAYGLVGLTAVAMIAVGARRSPGLRSSWLLLALGTVASIAGDALWILYEHVLVVDPFPSAADGAYLLSYPLLAAGYLLRVRRQTEGADRGAFLDAAIIATGTGVLTWVFLIAPYATDQTMSVGERLISLAYPLGDVLLVAVAARVAFVRGRGNRVDTLLALSLLSMLAADVLYYGSSILTPDTAQTQIADFGYLAAYALLGAAALHPTRTPRGADGRRPALRSSRLALLAAASLLAPASMAAGAVRADRVSLLVGAGASAALFLLVLFRMEGLVRQVQRQADALQRLATTDGLTGLANRRRWETELPRALAGAARRGAPLCVAVLDLDHFKRFNDEHGHLAGDDLLRGLAAVWQPLLRPDDLLARYGGEEFALLLPGLEVEQSRAVVERLCAATPQGQTFSAGVSAWDGIETPEALTARADQALYEAKRAGRACTIAARDPVTA